MQKHRLKDPKIYFKTTLDLFSMYKLDQLMIRAIGGKFNPGENSFDYANLYDKIKKSIPSLNFIINCEFHEGKQYLFELRILFDINFKPLEMHDYKTDCNENKKIIVNLY